MDKSQYLEVAKDRKKYVDSILDSDSPFKVVVAGPGTGKTFLFRKLLVHKPNSLTLTFINSLVEDLSLELGGITKVKTLHGFARSVLSKITRSSIDIFPKLSAVIKEDALILLDEEIDFDFLLYNRELRDKNFEFYKSRKDYYGYYGYNDIIFAAVECFEKHNDSIPSYEQILIDEFQDFNKLEVALIELLSEKSPILLTGDDDQALYDFKSANTKFIRQKYDSKNSDYKSFSLPYCSRSTNVIVDTVNDIVNSATSNGYLEGRIPKEFIYFNEKDRDEECKLFSKVFYTHKFDRQIPWFINSRIEEMALELRKNFSVLIISPYRDQCSAIVNSLKKLGLKNIDYVPKPNQDITFFDAIKLLLGDKNSILGWRIVLKWILNDDELTILIKNIQNEPEKHVSELVTSEQKKEVKKILKVYKSIINRKSFDVENFKNLIDKIGLNMINPMIELLKEEIEKIDTSPVNPSIKKINVKVTTIQSSKGLAADLVIITHFDDRYFIKQHVDSKPIISNQDICNFIVALSRAMKKVHLISTVKKPPIFLEWINPDRIQMI